MKQWLIVGRLACARKICCGVNERVAAAMSAALGNALASLEQALARYA